MGGGRGWWDWEGREEEKKEKEEKRGGERLLRKVNCETRIIISGEMERSKRMREEWSRGRGEGKGVGGGLMLEYIV